MKMKRSLITAVKVMAVAFMFTFASCDSPWFDPIDDGGGNGGGKPPVITDCNVNGTMVRVTCGTSIYDNLWIRTDNGKLLRPCDQSFQTICAIELKEGQRVKFSYREINGTSPCDGMITCMATLPVHKSVIIDCINGLSGKPLPVDSPAVSTGKLVIGSTTDNPSVHVLSAGIEGNLLKLSVGYSGCSKHEAKDFSLTWNGNVMESYPARVYLYIDESKKEMCQAYFITDLTFDISDLRKNNQGPLLIHIKDLTLRLD